MTGFICLLPFAFFPWLIVPVIAFGVVLAYAELGFWKGTVYCFILMPSPFWLIFLVGPYVQH